MSDATTWTPGPWTLVWHGNEAYPYPLSVLADDGGVWIARAGTVSSEANARLIAAAPKMAEALQALLADVFFASADDQFCEVCQQGVPTDDDGASIGRVEHADGCAYAAARTALAAARSNKEG